MAGKRPTADRLGLVPMRPVFGTGTYGGTSCAQEAYALDQLQVQEWMWAWVCM